MVAKKVFLDPRGVDCVFCYTDTQIPLDSIITINDTPAYVSKVFTSADGWNPGPGNSNQGVIGFNYSNTAFSYGDTFVINSTAGNTTVSNYNPVSYLFYSDGSSLDGWTFTNPTVTNSSGNPTPCFDFKFTAGYMNRNFGQAFTSKTIQFDAYFINGRINCYYGCNSSGSGPYVTISQDGTSSGFGAFTTSWSNFGFAIDDLGGPFANNWFTFKIVTNSGALNTSQLYINNVLKATTNQYIAVESNTYWGFLGSNVFIDNIYIYEGVV
jgi:hypothetical protein